MCLLARHKHITQDYENKLMYFGSVDGVLAMYPVRIWHLIHNAKLHAKHSRVGNT